MRACLTILGGLGRPAVICTCLRSSANSYRRSKITCEQFVHSKVGNPRTVAAWLSGFYHGQKGATTRRHDSVRRKCRSAAKVLL